ncbi:MAG: ABC transporter ATP-binding protein [Clostridia bacterium]|nr:ABC transporter ATP-binding protein [Clostridia bacterium]
MIKISNLNKSFNSRQLYKDFNMNIEDGDFVIFKGPSGCGKTTLLNMIGGIEDIDSGSVIVNGYDTSKKRDRQKILSEEVGFLFQNFALVEEKTVKQNLGFVKKKYRQDIDMKDALSFVGLPEDILKAKVYTLSGGEQQRVAIARLIMKKCNIILADEPTGSLDRKNADMVFDLLDSLNKQGKTIVLVTHDSQLFGRGKIEYEI